MAHGSVFARHCEANRIYINCACAYFMLLTLSHCVASRLLRVRLVTSIVLVLSLWCEFGCRTASIDSSGRHSLHVLVYKSALQRSVYAAYIVLQQEKDTCERCTFTADVEQF